MQQGIPTQDEVLHYCSALSNWGRWGAEDQLGTLHFITPEKTRRAVGLVREGVTMGPLRLFNGTGSPLNPIAVL